MKRRIKKPLSIDRRQQLAAAFLMVGFDLPIDMEIAGEQMLLANKCCPGITIADIGDMGEHNRRQKLTKAASLIAEMISEIDSQKEQEG